MKLLESLSQSTSVRMGGVTRLLANCWSIEASNLLDFLKYGVADCYKSSTYELTLRPQFGAVPPMETLFLVTLVPSLSLESGLEYFLIPLWIGLEIGMDPSMPVLMIRRGVMLIHALIDVAFTNISCTTGFISVCGVSLIVRLVGGGKTETSPMVRPLNMFGPKFHC